MCGIVGVITSRVTSIERKIFKDLLFMDTLRGWDSTGLITRDTKGDTYMYKRALAAPDFMFLPVPKAMMDKQWKMAIGHNRAATKGAVNDENAHPFKHDHIIGCHNGTLTSCTNLEDHTKFSVDSDNLFYDLAKNGAEVTIPKLRGAFCLAWYDMKKDTFNLIRNSQRPMYYCWNKAGNFFAFASEEHMLRAAISGDRQGRSAYAVEEVRELEVGQWIQINVGTLKAHIKKLELGKDALPVNSYGGGSHKGSYKTYPKKNPPATTTQTSQTQSTSVGGTNSNGTSKGGNVLPFKKDKNTKMRIVSWDIHQGHFSNLSYIAEGYTAMGQKAICYIPESVYNLLADESQEKPLPSHINAERVCNMQRGKDLVVVLDACTAYNLKYEVQQGTAKKSKRDHVNKRELYFGFNSETLTQSTYKSRTKEGCCNCDKVPQLSDSKKLHWIDYDNHLCDTCKQDYFEGRIGIEVLHTQGKRPICYTVN